MIAAIELAKQLEESKDLVADLENQIAEGLAGMDQAEARAAMLEGALKPFADAAKNLDNTDKDEWSAWESVAAGDVKLGDFRRADQALSGDGSAYADVVADMRKRKDGAYEERNRVVAALARLFPSGVTKTNIPGWDEEWHGCVYIDLPTGQVSWHFHDTQTYLFDGLPPYQGEWDGHDTPEKYRRVQAVDKMDGSGP